MRYSSRSHTIVGEEVNGGAGKVDVDPVNLSIVRGAIAVCTAINLEDVAVAG